MSLFPYSVARILFIKKCLCIYVFSVNIPFPYICFKHIYMCSIYIVYMYILHICIYTTCIYIYLIDLETSNTLQIFITRFDYDFFEQSSEKLKALIDPHSGLNISALLHSRAVGFYPQKIFPTVLLCKGRGNVPVINGYIAKCGDFSSAGKKNGKYVRTEKLFLILVNSIRK